MSDVTSEFSSDFFAGVGIPKTCKCGRYVSLHTSQTEKNPGRRYYRCDFAHERKLTDDDHLFKWVDVALVDEVAILNKKILDLRKDLGDIFIWMTRNQKFLDDAGRRIEETVASSLREKRNAKLTMYGVSVVAVVLFLAVRFA